MPTPSADDRAASREMLRRGSKSFFAASLLLPARVRRPATALYAFCRAADDAVDGGDDPAAAVDELRRRLDLVYRGRPGHRMVDQVFADVVHRFALPRALPEALIEGFAWDAAGRRYVDLPALEGYATRVAGTVGMMMVLLMGRRDELTLARAADLGIAMQYTNIARDVGEDARAGRLYLPLDRLAAAGLDPDRFLRSPAASEGLREVTAFLLDCADRHYRRAEAGVARLPPDCRPAIHAARLVYREIGRRLLASGGDPVAGRTVVPAGRKAALMVAAIGSALVPAGGDTGPPAETARELVRQVAAAPAPRPAVDPVGRMVDILTALEGRQRVAAGLPPVRPRTMARRGM